MYFFSPGFLWHTNMLIFVLFWDTFLFTHANFHYRLLYHTYGCIYGEERQQSFSFTYGTLIADHILWMYVLVKTVMDAELQLSIWTQMYRCGWLQYLHVIVNIHVWYCAEKGCFANNNQWQHVGDVACSFIRTNMQCACVWRREGTSLSWELWQVCLTDFPCQVPCFGWS